MKNKYNLALDLTAYKKINLRLFTDIDIKCKGSNEWKRNKVSNFGFGKTIYNIVSTNYKSKNQHWIT